MDSDAKNQCNECDVETELLKKDLEMAKQQAEDYLNGWKRAKADYLNLKKETDNKQKDLVEFATAGVLLEIFPLIDQFKQAFRHLPKDLENSEWVNGIRHIQSNLNRILNTYEIKEVPALGEKFNPEFHEAVEEVTGTGKEKGMIVEELQTGFMMNGKAIQAAKVKVAGEADETSAQNEKNSAEESGGTEK